MFLTFDDQRLLDETDKNVQAEREATVRVLRNFLEIDRRRLYSAMGKGSLKEFVMDRYQFSLDEAWRRINAMKLLVEAPQIEKKIEEGSLTLTHVGLAQSLFRHERKNHERIFSKEQKLRVLEKMENTSTREAQRLTFSLASSPMVKSEDKVRPISHEKVEIKFAAPYELEQKLEKLKGLKAHSNPNMSCAELIDMLCDLGLKEWDPAQRTVRTAKVKPTQVPDVEASALAENTGSHHVEKFAAPRTVSGQPRPARVHITANLETKVWRHYKSRCANCGSTYALQIDHVKPIALGGANTLDNIRLLCRSCNQRAAIQAFGVEKMQSHLQEAT